VLWADLQDSVFWPTGISPYQPSRLLWSSNQLPLTVSHANLTIGQCAFSYSWCPVIWNAILLSITDAMSISTFKRHLKSFYFHSFISPPSEYLHIWFDLCLAVLRVIYLCMCVCMSVVHVFEICRLWDFSSKTWQKSLPLLLFWHCRLQHCCCILSRSAAHISLSMPGYLC